MQNLSAVAIQSPQVTTPHTGRIESPSVLPPVVEIPEPQIKTPDIFSIPSDGNTTLAVDSPRAPLDTASMHQHVMNTSDMLTDVRWWLHLTLQDIQERQASNDLHVAKILVRQCTKTIRRYRSEPKAVMFQELLVELSSHGRFYWRGDYMLKNLEWLDGGYLCRMKLNYSTFQDPEILSLYLRVRDSSGILPDRTLEIRLYFDAERRLSTEHQAYIIVGGHHSLEKNVRFTLGYVRDDIYKQSLETWQKILSEQPCTVFLRDDIGNVALSVSRLLPKRLIVALTIQGCSEIRPAINISPASQARIASLQCSRVRTSLST